MQQEAEQYHQVLWGKSISNMEAFITRNNQSVTAVSKQMLEQAATQTQGLINKALEESKKSLQEVVAQSVQAQTVDISKQLKPSIERARHAANMSFVAACVAVFAAGLALLASF